MEEKCASDSRIKDEAAFPLDPPQHYPPDSQYSFITLLYVCRYEQISFTPISFSVVRPTFGCRCYLRFHVFKLIPALANDLRDWLVETRIKTAQLCYVLMIQIEGEAIQFTEKLLDIFNKGTSDTEPLVVQYVSIVNAEASARLKLLKIDFQNNIFLNEVLVNFRSAKQTLPKTSFLLLFIVLEILLLIQHFSSSVYI